jgi:hypothetical protein
MTPKEKAKELYGKFWRETPQPYTERVEYYKESKLIFNDWDKDWINRLAKESALIAVDEILLIAPMMHMEGFGNLTIREYYKKVKQEIEKL